MYASGPLAAHPVGELHAKVEPSLDVRAPVRGQAVYRPSDVAVVGVCVLHRQLVYHVRREVHHADSVAAPQAPPDTLGGLPGYVDAVAVCHRARRIEHEGHVEGLGVL